MDSAVVALLILLSLSLFYPLYFVGEDVPLIMTGDGLDFGGAMARIWGSSLTGERGGGGLYRPLTLTTFLIERKIWGLNPAGYHLVNILLNALCTVLLYFIAKIFLKKPIYAFLTSLIFLFHPAHPSTIHWISARGDLLCTAGYLAGLLFSLHYVFKGGKPKIFLAGGCFLIAFFSKEMAITAPITAVLVAYSAAKENCKGRVRWVFVSAVIPAIAFVSARVAFLGITAAEGGDYYLAFGKFFAVNAAKAFGFLFIPFGHESAEQFLFAQRSNFTAIATVCIIVISVFAFYVLRKNKTALILSICLAVSVLPVMGMVMRWHMYLPSVFLTLAMGICIFGRKPKALALVIYSVVLILFVVGFGILRSNIGRSSDFSRGLIKQGTEVLEDNPEAEGFVFMMLPSKVHRTATYTNGFVPTLQGVSGDRRPMLEVLPSVHYGDYRSCEYSVEDGSLIVRFDFQQDYIAPRVRDYLIGETKLTAGNRISTDDGLELEILKISEIGRISSVEVDLEQDILPQGSLKFIFYSGKWQILAPTGGISPSFIDG